MLNNWPSKSTVFKSSKVKCLLQTGHLWFCICFGTLVWLFMFLGGKVYYRNAVIVFNFLSLSFKKKKKNVVNTKGLKSGQVKILVNFV